MAYEYILVEKESGVAILTMNRPAQLNAMNRQLSSELHDAVTQMVADDDISCIVITGAGERAFTAGGDIHEQRENDRAFTQQELDARGAVRSRRRPVRRGSDTGMGAAGTRGDRLCTRRLAALRLRTRRRAPGSQVRGRTHYPHRSCRQQRGRGRGPSRLIRWAR